MAGQELNGAASDANCARKIPGPFMLRGVVLGMVPFPGALRGACAHGAARARAPQANSTPPPGAGGPPALLLRMRLHRLVKVTLLN
jgi:hypothetical protein